MKKRVLALILLSCMLFTGCKISVNTHTRGSEDKVEEIIDELPEDVIQDDVNQNADDVDNESEIEDNTELDDYIDDLISELPEDVIEDSDSEYTEDEEITEEITEDEEVEYSEDLLRRLSFYEDNNYTINKDGVTVYVADGTEDCEYLGYGIKISEVVYVLPFNVEQLTDNGWVFETTEDNKVTEPGEHNTLFFTKDDELLSVVVDNFGDEPADSLTLQVTGVSSIPNSNTVILDSGLKVGSTREEVLDYYENPYSGLLSFDYETIQYNGLDEDTEVDLSVSFEADKITGFSLNYYKK